MLIWQQKRVKWTVVACVSPERLGKLNSFAKLSTRFTLNFKLLPDGVDQTLFSFSKSSIFVRMYSHVRKKSCTFEFVGGQLSLM